MKRIFTLLIIAFSMSYSLAAQEIYGDDDTAAVDSVEIDYDIDGDDLDDDFYSDDLLQRALDGDVDAMVNLGWCYEKGAGIEPDLNKAVEWYTKAAKLGDNSALFNLGLIALEDWDDIMPDEDLARSYFEKAANNGFAPAQYMLGNIYFNDEQYTNAIEWWQKAAEQGETAAIASLGYCYYLGKGVDLDFDEAFRLFNDAINDDNINGVYYLGECYYIGRGVEKDHEMAAELYERGALEEDPDCALALGYCYEMGEGVPQDYEEAAKWYALAADQGSYSALRSLAWLYDNGLGVPQNAEMADSLRSACDDEITGLVQFDYGNGPEYSDYIEHSRKIKQLADNGDQQAIAMLANMYITGSTMKQDTELGMEMLEAATDADNYYAMASLGELLVGTNPDIDHDTDRGIQLLTAAADAGIATALYELGQCYEIGIGVEVDTDKAIDLYKRAINAGARQAKSALEILLNSNND